MKARLINSINSQIRMPSQNYPITSLITLAFSSNEIHDRPKVGRKLGRLIYFLLPRLVEASEIVYRDKEKEID